MVKRKVSFTNKIRKKIIDEIIAHILPESFILGQSQPPILIIPPFPETTALIAIVEPENSV